MKETIENDNIYIYTGDPEESEDYVNPQDAGGCATSTDRPEDSSCITDGQGVDDYQEEHDSQTDSSGDEVSDKVGYDISVFGLLLKTMLNPIEGWKSFRRDKVTEAEAQRNCFYPLLSLYAVSKFAIYGYASRTDLSSVVVDAVVSFVSFFFGYYCIMIVLRAFMPKNVRPVFYTDFGKVFVIVSLSTLSVFFTMMELLPMLWAVLIFLPLWTVYMICRGERFFKIPDEHHILYVGLMNLVIVGIPVMIDWGLSKIVPN